MAKLTKSQRDALQHMADDDGRIIYLPGGWWTTAKFVATAKGRNIGPAWSIGKSTVRGLENHGFAVATDEGPYYARTRIITAAGREALGPKDDELQALTATVGKLLK